MDAKFIILTDTEKEVLESLCQKIGLEFKDLENIKKMESVFEEIKNYNIRLELCEKACNTLVNRLRDSEERISSLENMISNMQREEMGINL